MVSANPQVERGYIRAGKIDDWYDLPFSGDAIDEWRSGSAGSARVIGSRGAIPLASQDVRVHVVNVPHHMVGLRSILDKTLPASTEDLRRRLDNANRHFRRKAAAVLGDEDAVRLLAELYQSFNLDIEEFDTCRQGIALAKLTAANFCEVGAKVIYITEAGQSFIEALHRE